LPATTTPAPPKKAATIVATDAALLSTCAVSSMLSDDRCTDTGAGLSGCSGSVARWLAAVATGRYILYRGRQAALHICMDDRCPFGASVIHVVLAAPRPARRFAPKGRSPASGQATDDTRALRSRQIRARRRRASSTDEPRPPPAERYTVTATQHSAPRRRRAAWPHAGTMAPPSRSNAQRLRPAATHENRATP
jgi:hypothetical protein